MTREVDRQWISREDMLDVLERERQAWIEGRLPGYVRFHRLNAAHLPRNFRDRKTGAPLSQEDGRAALIDRVGYFNYAIFVNLALAERSAKNATTELKQLSDLWDVYESISGVFLRLGAAIDIARLLGREVELAHAAEDKVFFSGGSHAGDTLKAEISEVDAYNNFLKHTGLVSTALTHVTDSSTFEVLVPRQVNMGMRSWVGQTPEVELENAARDAVTESLKSFSSYFFLLADRVPELHKRLAIAPISADDCVGIGTAKREKTPGYDGYGPPTEALSFLLPTSGSADTTPSGVNIGFPRNGDVKTP
jgi:hypothetical protein